MSRPPRELETLRQDARSQSERLQHARTRDEALEIAITAAETSMTALKLASDPVEKKQLSTRVKQLLNEADRIKASTDWRQTSLPALSQPKASVSASAPARPAKLLKEPVTSRVLPKAEQILLWKASLVNGHKFPPWAGPPSPDEFNLHPGEQLFTDSAELGLSAFQQEVFDGWRRPADALPPPSWFSGDRTNLGPSMSFSPKLDIVQDAATDCSVVASLCAGAARAEQGHAKLLPEVLHPYDPENGRPVMSQNGKYIVRLNFNGCYRKVVIDDRLPTSKTSRVIHVVDRHHPGLLWPALMEKAYLKVRGGYDFPGSNSGTDLWILSGWIPEQVFLQSDDLEPDVFWRKTLNAFKYGDVMVTMGTGKISARAEREIGLAGEHDYAVINMQECDGQRLFLIKNPWCEGTSWRGRFKEKKVDKSTVEETMGLLDLNDSDDEPVQSTRDLLNADDQLSPGTFWMDLDNVIQHFESIYLNWNPGLFALRQDIHFAWDLRQAGAACERFGSLRKHPQFSIETEETSAVWLLLCRHFRNVETPEDDTAQLEIDLRGYISLHSFFAGGRKVLMPEGVSQQSNFVDSPQILLKLDECQAHKPITLVPGGQELSTVYHSFTISAFSNSPFVLQEALEKYICSTDVKGAWTKDTAGGNAHSAKYSTNPQFSISIPYKTALSLLLETDNAELNVHLKLVHGKGKRVRSVRNRDIVVDSKDYRRQCCVAETSQVEPGVYTIICSTFEPQQLGHFTLLVESALPTQVSLLPREDAGRLKLELHPARLAQSINKLAAPLVPNRLVKLYAVARRQYSASAHETFTPRSPSHSSLVRLSIELGRGPNKQVLVSSGDGEYSDSTAGGIQTEDIDLSPEMLSRGDLWLVIDRMHVPHQAHQEQFAVELVVDQPCAVDAGIWRNWED